MSEEVSKQAARDEDALGALLQVIASQADATPGQVRWDSLAELIDNCGADGTTIGIAEFDALDRAPADKNAARALAFAILRLAESDDDFGSAFASWRSICEPQLAGDSPAEETNELARAESRQQPGSSAVKPGGENHDSTRLFIDHATFIATLLTMVFALLAIQWSYFRVISLLALVAAGLAVWQSRLRRRSWKERPVLISGLACAVACAVLTISTAVSLLDSSYPISPGRTVQDRTISAAISGKFYRIIYPIVNNSSGERQIESVTILVSFWGQPCAESPLVQLFQLKDSVKVNSDKKIVAGGVSVESGEAAKGLSVPVSGLINDGCTLNQLQLTFRPPGAELPRNSTTLLEVDIPKHLNVTYQSASYSQTVGLPNVVNPYAGNFIAFHVIASISGGRRLGSCFMLTGSRPSPGAAPGTHNCNASIGGTHVFWLEVFQNKSSENPGMFFKKID